MTLSELAAALDERALSLVVHQGAIEMTARAPESWWVAWIYPPDDPIQLCTGEGPTIDVAIMKALAKWDRTAEPS